MAAKKAAPGASRRDTGTSSSTDFSKELAANTRSQTELNENVRNLMSAIQRERRTNRITAFSALISAFAAVVLAIITGILVLDQRRSGQQTGQALANIEANTGGLEEDYEAAHSPPPRLIGIETGCGEVDLANQQVLISDPRRCETIAVTFKNEGVTPRNLRVKLHIGGIYELFCLPEENQKTIAPQSEATFTFDVDGCMQEYTSSANPPAPGAIEHALD